MSEKDRRRHYDGQTDALNLRFGRGVQKFPKKEGDETYLGRFKRDVYHGPGQYLARNIFTEPWSYEGMFNANRLEGYGVLSFASKSIFSVRPTTNFFHHMTILKFLFYTSHLISSWYDTVSTSSCGYSWLYLKTFILITSHILLFNHTLAIFLLC